MDLIRLMAQMDNPTLHRTILGGFNGPYSLGIGKDEVSSQPVLVLMVPHDATQTFPASVAIEGQSVPLVIQRDFRQPSPFSHNGTMLTDA